MSNDPIATLASIRRDKPTEEARAHFWPLIIIVLILLSLAVGFFSSRNVIPPAPTVSPSGTPDREPRIYVVSYRFGVFSPTNLRIHAGDTVRFRNDSPLPMRITAQLEPGDRTPEFDSVGNIQPESYFSYTFANLGIFGYYNHEHPDETGVIIVR